MILARTLLDFPGALAALTFTQPAGASTLFWECYGCRRSPDREPWWDHATVLAAVFLLLASPAQAVSIIDNFDDNAGTVTITRLTPGTTSDGPDLVPTGVIGQRRTTRLTLTSSAIGPLNDASVHLNPPDNQISFSADSGVSATYELFYGGPGGTEVGAFDPDSDGTTQFEIVFVAADQGSTVTITVVNGITTSKSVGFIGPGTLLISYAGGWSGGHTIGQGSFQDADTITVTIVGAVAGDYTIDEIRTGGSAVVPEPSTLLLGAVGLALAAGLRRFAR